MLAGHGWECAVLSGPETDLGKKASFENILRAENPAFQVRPGTVLNVPCTLYQCVLNKVRFHAFVPGASQPGQPPIREIGQAFLSLFDMVCKRFRPDILLTYGGHGLAFPLIHLAKQKGLKVVFALHNLDYAGTDLFREVDALLVPSRYAQEHYREKLSRSSVVLPGPWNLERILCSEITGRFVTFVNPQPYKGAFWFARMVHELGRRRPDIAFLVVEGRGTAGWLARSGLDLADRGNLHRMANTADPRQFYRMSRLVLMPSLCQEALGRVAVEAALNGIPVLASRRGGLPEALNGAGFLFDIPERYTSHSQEVPTAEEVTPWLETIERLWDDPIFYGAESDRSRLAAEVWLPECLRPRFEEFFTRIAVQTSG